MKPEGFWLHRTSVIERKRNMTDGQEKKCVEKLINKQIKKQKNINIFTNLQTTIKA